MCMMYSLMIAELHVVIFINCCTDTIRASVSFWLQMFIIQLQTLIKKLFVLSTNGLWKEMYERIHSSNLLVMIVYDYFGWKIMQYWLFPTIVNWYNVCVIIYYKTYNYYSFRFKLRA